MQHPKFSKEDLIHRVKELEQENELLRENQNDEAREHTLNSVNQELIESEQRFRLMTEYSPVMIWESGLDAKCNYFNKRWLEFRGREMHEEIGDGWTEGLHPDDFDYCVNNYLEAFHKHEGFELEYRLKNKDGNYRWLIDIGIPRFNESGEFAGFMGSCIDVTERRIFEHIQKEKEVFYEALFQKNKAIKLLIDPETGRIIDANKAAVNFYGYSLSTLKSMKITEINMLSEEDLKRKMQEAASGEGISIEFVHKLADGSFRDVEIYSGPVSFEGKELLHSIITDVTERKRAKEALQQSEEKYRLIVNSLPQYISYCSTDFRYLYVNKTYEKEFGVKQKEIEGQRIIDIIGENAFEQAKVHMQKVIEGEYVRYYEKLEYKNGSVKHIDGQLIPHFGADKKVVGYYGVLTDISPYVETREALEKSELEKRVILESTSEMMVYCDKELNIIWANKAARDLKNIDEKDISNKKCFDIWHNEDKPCVGCPVVKTLNSGKMEETEIIFRERNMKVRSYPVFDENGKIEGVVEFVEDITEQKKKDNEQKRIYNLYRTLASNLPEINVILFDMDKRILIMEGSEFRDGIYKKSDFEGKLVTELNYKQEAISYLENLYSSVLKGEKVSGELSSNNLWYRHVAVPIKTHNYKVIGGLVVVQNITEQKKATIELENSKEKLKQLSAFSQQLIERERSHVAREIHDELGQNLTFIKLNLALIGQKLSKPDKKEIKLQFKNIYEVLDKTIQKVKKISSELRPKVIDDLGIVPAIEWHISEFMKQTGLKCTFNYNNDDIDINNELAINIFRIIQEALTNSLKHAKATEVNVDFKELPGELLIEIQDNGKGMKQTEIHKPNSLGILGMKERVELFNGTFSIKGSAKNGTTIKIRIPLKK